MRNVVNLKKGMFIVLCFFFAGSTIWAQDSNHIKIATWNIEHLGSPGRGLGGIGAGNLPPRTSNQLRTIARLIEDDLHADLVAVQEIAISQITESGVESEALETIVDELGDGWEYHIGIP